MLTTLARLLVDCMDAELEPYGHELGGASSMGILASEEKRSSEVSAVEALLL